MGLTEEIIIFTYYRTDGLRSNSTSVGIPLPSEVPSSNLEAFFASSTSHHPTTSITTVGSGRPPRKQTRISTSSTGSTGLNRKPLKERVEEQVTSLCERGEITEDEKDYLLLLGKTGLKSLRDALRHYENGDKEQLLKLLDRETETTTDDKYVMYIVCTIFS